MATTTASNGSVELEDTETITEPALGRLLARDNVTGYREKGLGLTADHANEQYDIGSGLAYVLDRSNDEGYPLRLTGSETGISFATTTGVNYIYLSFDPTADSDDVTIHTLTTDSPPSDPSVRLGEIDAGNDANPVESDQNPEETVDILEIRALATQSVTLTGGSDPADETLVTDVTVDEHRIGTPQQQPIEVLVAPDADPSFDADYEFHARWNWAWDDSDTAVDVRVRTIWDTDPGSSNDVSGTIYVLPRQNV